MPTAARCLKGYGANPIRATALPTIPESFSSIETRRHGGGRVAVRTFRGREN